MTMNSYNEYKKSKKELEYFVQEIKKMETKEASNEYQDVFYKSCIVLLVTKLEKFTIQTCLEFYYTLVDKKCVSQQVPKPLKDEYTCRIIGDLDTKIKSSNLTDKDIELLRTIEILWNTKYDISNISFEPKFESRNHGSNALKKLFRQIGFDDIFSNIDDLYVISGSPLIETKTAVDVKSKINHIINLRHKVVHHDIEPNITFKDLEVFVKSVDHFISEVNLAIDSRLSII